VVDVTKTFSPGMDATLLAGITPDGQMPAGGVLTLKNLGPSSILFGRDSWQIARLIRVPPDANHAIVRDDDGRPKWMVYPEGSTATVVFSTG